MQLSHPDRELAKQQGRLKYFTGIPCKNGHLAERWVKGANCVDCLKDAKTKHKSTDRYKDTTKSYSKNYRPKLVFKLYGLTEEDYAKLLNDQNFKCKICRNDLQGNRKTHIDHCHKTNKVRGILCWNCNVGIGHLKHNPELLRKAALYCEET